MVHPTSFFPSFTLFLHMIGFGMIAAILIGNAFAERHFRLATDWSQRARLGMLMKNIGLMSPIAALILLGSGIGNMIAFGFSMGQAFGPEAPWLGVKIVLFFIAVANGTIVSMKMGKKRFGIIMGVKNGGSSEQGEAALRATYGTMNVFYCVQMFLILCILTMVLFRPF